MKAIWIACLTALALAGCVSAGALHNPHIAAQIDDLQVQSERLYAGLATASAPRCDHEYSKIFYNALHTSAQKLQADLAAKRASAALNRAADSLRKALLDAERSHQLASARTDDPHGPCLAPEAIALNADAIARASKALATAQQGEAQ